MSQRNIDDILDDIEHELTSNEYPKAADAARAEAILKANQTFDQAFAQTARPKDKSTDSFFRSFFMSIFSKQPLGQGFSYAFGTLAVVGIAVPILMSYQTTNAPTSILSTEPAEEFNDDQLIVDEIEIETMAAKVAAPVPRPESTVADFSSSHAKPAAREIQVKRESSLIPEKSVLNHGFLPQSAPSPVEGELLGTNSPARPDLAEEYAEYDKSSIVRVADEPISTFSADVDTASYSLVRNQLNQGYLPAQTAVRPEEFINYFNYDYPTADSKKRPFKPTISLMDSPWNEGKKLVHIGIKGYDIDTSEAPDSNIVFLIDVSGSMSAANKLPLAKQSILFLAEQLKPSDKISIVVYAGAAGVVLEPTDAKDKTALKTALGKLNAGGSTAGGAGIELAYQVAQQNFDKEAVNRIVLLTDGDFNVGQSSNQELLELVERKRNGGVMLSVLGFGRDNYQDDMMQTLAQNGNGIATYIDTLNEAKKVMVDEATSTLFPIAKDVKFQVEFNPSTVSDYRLVGYETRALRTEDFNNDKIDAGDIGAGHTVTAIYEITPADAEKQSIDAPRYSGNQPKVAQNNSRNEYGFVKLRYKLPKEDKSTLIEAPIKVNQSAPSADAKFSIAVAGFAQLLSGNKHVGDLNFEQVAELAKANKGSDEFGYRAEFIQLVKMAELIQ